MVSHHTLIRVVRSELHRSEFVVVVSPQHTQLRWPELYRGDGKTELALFTKLLWETIYTTLPI